MRRAARERYRVYAEDEFFANPRLELGREDGQSPAGRTSVGRRSRRIASAAVLVGALGAAGGVLAVDIFSPGYAWRRATARVASDTQVKRGSVASSVLDNASESTPRFRHRLRRGALSRLKRTTSQATRRHRAPTRQRLVAEVAERSPNTAAVAAADPAGGTAVAVATRSGTVANPELGLSDTSGPYARRSEFGFER